MADPGARHRASIHKGQKAIDFQRLCWFQEWEPSIQQLQDEQKSCLVALLIYVELCYLPRRCVTYSYNPHRGRVTDCILGDILGFSKLFSRTSSRDYCVNLTKIYAPQCPHLVVSNPLINTVPFFGHQRARPWLFPHIQQTLVLRSNYSTLSVGNWDLKP